MPSAFSSFAIAWRDFLQIAKSANAEGNPWQMQTIDIILRNELYLGHNVFNRRSRKLKQKTVCSPPEMWVRCEHTFKPLISPELFAKTQKVFSISNIAERSLTRIFSRS